MRIFIIIILLLHGTLGYSQSDPEEWCPPEFNFSILTGPKTYYEMKDLPAKIKLFGRHYTRIAYGWEPVQIRYSVKIPRDSHCHGNYHISVASEKYWFDKCSIELVEHFTEKHVSYISLDPSMKVLHSKSGNTDTTRLCVGESIGVDRIFVVPTDSKGSPLEPGHYRIRMFCDLKSIAGKISGLSEKYKSVMRYTKIGEAGIEVFLPRTKIEIAEEEMHKALYYRKFSISSDEIIRHLVKVLEIDTNNYQALEILSDIYLRKGDFNEARPLINRCLQLQPKREGCLYQKYWITNKKVPLDK